MRDNKGTAGQTQRFENPSLEGGEQCPEPKNAFSDVGGAKRWDLPWRLQKVLRPDDTGHTRLPLLSSVTVRYHICAVLSQ